MFTLGIDVAIAMGYPLKFSISFHSFFLPFFLINYYIFKNKYHLGFSFQKTENQYRKNNIYRRYRIFYTQFNCHDIDILVCFRVYNP